jgi:carboxyl-terminal processing protease
LNAAGAGHRGQTRQLDLLRGGERIALELGDPPPVALDTPLNARMIGDIGYIRFNDSLGDPGTVTAFDAAVDGMRSAKGWIIDLRDTPSGGSTDVAEPVMGRFIAETADYQITQPLQATAYPRSIVARGPWTLSGPVAVLVGRWTGSMGEGMAIGFDGMKRGTVVGGPMAGLAGGVEVFKLPSTDTDLRLPTYGLAHMDGTPRHRWTPEVLVQPDLGGAQDPALSRAIRIVGGE